MQHPDDIPIPTSRPPPTRTAGTLRRAKTLTRPERGVAQAPMINPPAPIMPATVLPTSATTLVPGGQANANAANESSWSVWSIFAHIVTFWAPPVLLSSLGGIKDKPSRQAWREKVALCFIALLLGGIVGFATMGLSKALCPDNQKSDLFIDVNSTSLLLGIEGSVFNISQSLGGPGVNFFQLAANNSGRDITPLFTRTAASYRSCNGMKFKAATDEPCSSLTPCKLEAPIATTFAKYRLLNTTFIVGYDWNDVAKQDNYMVLDGNVLNMSPYMTANPKAIPGDSVDKAIRTVLQNQSGQFGRDATMLFSNRDDLKAAMPCLTERYIAGNIDKISPGCFVSTLFLYSSLIVILGVVMVRFAMACVFSWFMSHRLVAPPKNLNRKGISPAVMPEGANVAVDSKNGAAPWAMKKTLAKTPKGGKSATSLASETTATGGLVTMATIGAELFAVALVTCYSEGEESIRSTCDSIATTNYSDSRKLLFIVADGMITGAGEKVSTPDICVSLLEADPRFGNPMPMSYNAVGLGSKKENRAMVYAGHYVCKGHRTPTVIIVKCGTEAEAATDKKPGNRGKRDSQLILMNFFSRVTYNDRMTPLDFDLFRKTQVLMGVTPDYFEVCLMVDADTKVYPDSMMQLVNSMHHDKMIMGVCGETRIANKRQSWVTAIQVYEYFISHHLAKAFESVFGGVTCLPGCFSMYRLKARKEADDDWVPLIIKPEIVREYSQSTVTTLHQKNLLLLGEDRFLTTILLRTFPNRKMMFCPQAKCRTVVPDTFSILLSQRRRWINSTIHNLMELVLVRNLCGTFCFSMQFVVFMDLLGTTVLPVGLSLTYALVVALALDPPKTFEKSIPLILLVTVTGLPAILILLTTRKVVYVAWMFIYLIALPVWNFILPVYAFWHFDDFSWGETRKVEGEGKDTGHGDAKAGPYEGGTTVPMRRWEDWERSRLRKIRREEKRRRELERSYPRGSFVTGGREFYNPQSEYFEGSDTQSLAPSEDDQWGAQVGGYNENGSQFPPPPQPFVPDGDIIAGTGVVGGAELEAMLEMGFDDGPRSGGYPPQQKGNRGSDGSSGRGFNAYAAPPSNRSSPGRPPIHEAMSPIQPHIQPTSSTSAVGGDWKTHAKKRSGGRGVAVEGEREEWGPLGPLDPDGPNPGDFSGGGGGGRF